MLGDHSENETQNASSSDPSSPMGVSYVYGPSGVTEFQITLWSSVVVSGVIGNMLACLVILGRLKKTSMNYYLLSLAIADLGVLICIYPVAVVKYISPNRWLLGRVVCLYVLPTEEVFFGASIWSITVIAIERYVNIVGSRKYRFGETSHLRTRLIIMGVWLTSFLVSSVPLYPLMQDEPICQPRWPVTDGKQIMAYTYLISLIVVWYLLPLCVIAFTYVKIRERLRDSIAFRDLMSCRDRQANTGMPLSRGPTEKQIWRKSIKTRRILTPLVVLFALTMFPINALRTITLIKPEFVMNKYYNLIMGQMGLFVLINSSANPLVYYITSNEFKEAFKAVLKSFREKEKFLNWFRLRRPLSSWRSSKYETEENSANLRSKPTNRMSKTTAVTINILYESYL